MFQAIVHKLRFFGINLVITLIEVDGNEYHKNRVHSRGLETEHYIYVMAYI